MKVGHDNLIDRDYFSLADRIAISIEVVLSRGRKVIAVTTTTNSITNTFYATIFWTEE